jgi:hypothetical protein
LQADYVYCLQRSLAGGAPYVLLLEDDALAHAHLFRVLEHVLRTRVESEGAERDGGVAYIKLYHPLRLLGYISLQVERLSELLSLSVVLGAAFVFIHSLCRRWRGVSGFKPRRQQALPDSGQGGLLSPLHSHIVQHPHPFSQPGVMGKAREKSLFHKPHTPGESCVSRTPPLSHRQVLWWWLGYALMVAVLALAVGRPNLLELRRVSPHLYQVSPVPSCCIPAVLYTRHGAQSFAEFLSNVTCTASRSTDIRMDEWGAWVWREGGMRGLLIQPSLFSHIGLMSSLRTSEVSPLIVQ